MMASTANTKFSGSMGLLDWQIAHDEERNILWLETHGPLDMAPLEAFFDQVFAAANEYSCRCFFADHRSSQLRLNPVQIFDLPKTLRQHGIVEHKAAVLFAKVGEDEQFVETICKNFGIMARVFNDLDIALAWLMTEPSPGK